MAGKIAAQAWQIAWLDSSGKLRPLMAMPGTYSVPRISPDGRQLLYSTGSDIYNYDLERDTTTRLTFTGPATACVWAPDGRHVVFGSVGNRFGIFWVRSDASGEPEQLLESSNLTIPWSFAPDGRRLAYRETSPGTGEDLWTLPLDLTDPDRPKPGKPESFLRTLSNETMPKFSPDGRWIAYLSNESGESEIYVRPFPNSTKGRWQVSVGGGQYPFWSNNGRELFYETSDFRIMVLDYVAKGDSFLGGKPRLWSNKQIFYPGLSNLDLSPDGKRFAVLALPETPPGEKGTVHVTMLLNFFDELTRRIP